MFFPHSATIGCNHVLLLMIMKYTHCFPILIKSYRRICSVLILLGMLTLFFSSCYVSRPSYVLKNIARDTVITITPAPVKELTIQTSDLLQIFVSSLNKDEDLIYNAVENMGAGKAQGYRISADGYINFHKLGRIKVAGLTRQQLKEQLEKKLTDYLRDPIVTVNFGNHFVTVMGEVSRPAKVLIEEDQLSILDAISQSGSLTANSQVNKLVIIRDSASQRQIKLLNLEDQAFMQSGYYYLQPNDIVIVNPDERRVFDDARRLRTRELATISLQFLTAALVIYQTFFKN